ncbi:SIR2 family NAD-dependent protein deacylase [Moheibacter stercoris]|uniref:NAD-dependent protein deacylase n=1 Tax=Moheibacter stercoris TaxID=1628251 RepID=A0ABV2LWN4_9FLAO
MSQKKKIVVLTGAGISAESGISTFRDANGLWENHDIMEVASPQGWQKNPSLVLEFYNQRRRQLKEVESNSAHLFLKNMEERFDMVIITQNVDDLHERAGSSKVLHLHGELRKVRSEANEELVYNWEDDVHLGDLAEDGAQLRPHIVWFGEMVPMMETAIQEVENADGMIVIGTSLQVYPAASLLDFLPKGKPIYVIDPNTIEFQKNPMIQIIRKTATEGVLDIDFDKF